MYYTYILLCADGSYYVGKTTNPEKRILEHNGIKKGGAKYTRSKRPVTLKYLECFENNQLASQKERELKKLTHEQKELLCDISVVSICV